MIPWHLILYIFLFYSNGTYWIRTIINSYRYQPRRICHQTSPNTSFFSWESLFLCRVFKTLSEGSQTSLWWIRFCWSISSWSIKCIDLSFLTWIIVSSRLLECLIIMSRLVGLRLWKSLKSFGSFKGVSEFNSSKMSFRLCCCLNLGL